MNIGRLSFGHLKKLNKNGQTFKNYNAKSLNTFKVGGNFKYYLKINTIENFIKIMTYLEDVGVQPFVIGNGSNLLISDSGYSGVVISLGGDFGLMTVSDNCIEFGAGVMLGSAYVLSRDLSLGGLECGGGIPGTIGGATYMNAQAHDFEMAKVVEYVVAYHDGKIKIFDNEDCQFGYRKSVFQENNAIILRVGLKLLSAKKEDIQEKYVTILKARRDSQPVTYPSAGSVFKRIDGINVSKMLDESGFKRCTIGGAQVSEKHANFIINSGSATAQNIYDLIEKIKTEFALMHGIELTSEIRFLGDFDETNR